MLWKEQISVHLAWPDNAIAFPQTNRVKLPLVAAGSALQFPQQYFGWGVTAGMLILGQDSQKAEGRLPASLILLTFYLIWLKIPVINQTAISHLK